MRAAIIIIILLSFSNLYSQNLITNGDFENCNTSSLAGVSGCSALPDGDVSEFSYVDGNWFDIKLPPSNTRGTVDWWANGSVCQYWLDATSKSCVYSQQAESGSKFIGMFDGEGAEFDFGSPLPLGVYKITFWVKGNEFNTDDNFGVGSNGKWGASVTVSDSKMKLSSQCDIQSGFTVFQQTFDASDYQNWHQLSCFIETRTQAIQFIVFGGIFGRECQDHHAYFYLDNITVEKTCCATEMRYQNTSENPSISLLPRLTQRTDAIYAGTNVSLYSQLMTGPVIVKKDSFVRFEASQRILMVPGFSTELGSVFSSSIGDCQKENVTTNDYSIDLISYSGENGGLFHMWCDNSDLFHCLGFSSKGATHYRVRMLNEWHEKFYDAEGEISETWTPYFCGNGASGQSPLSGAIEVVLELYNCANYAMYDHQINIEYNTNIGCSPAAKTDFGAYAPDSIVINNKAHSGSILLFPNPANKVLHVKQNGDGNIEGIQIIDNLGQVVLTNATYIAANEFDMNIDGIASGLYYCIIKTNNEVISQKVIIKK